jgi:hypothetical protein
MIQMPEVIVLARTRVMATDAQLLMYRNKLQELESNRLGLDGITTWRSLEPDGGLLQIMRYANQHSADDALSDLINSKIGPLVASITIDPPDVLLMNPKKHSGKSPENVPVGGFCSFAVRFSDPGQQEELEMDTEEVLAELAFIPGYLGSMWGNNVALSEEIVSLAFWSSREALDSSIPNSHKVRLQRWQKAF